MQIKSAAVTNIGRVRQNNEDNFYLCGKYRKDVDLPNMSYTCSEKRDRYLFGVCDGMGGEAFGELASLIAVRLMNDYAESFSASVEQYVERANAMICSEIESHGGKRIGTTFTALSIEDGTAHAYNIGDSRIYLIRDGEIAQLSQDHTQVQTLINQGFISEEEAKKHPARHVLTQHMGIFPEEMVIETYCAEPCKLKDGDVFLLCSDGLTDALNAADLLEAVSGCADDLEAVADGLVDAAMTRGSRDNITVVLVAAAEEPVCTEQKTSRVNYSAAEEMLKKYSKSGNADLINELLRMMKNREN